MSVAKKYIQPYLHKVYDWTKHKVGTLLLCQLQTRSINIVLELDYYILTCFIITVVYMNVSVMYVLVITIVLIWTSILLIKDI